MSLISLISLMIVYSLSLRNLLVSNTRMMDDSITDGSSLSLSNCCASYGLRKQAMYNDLSRYTCCNGACPCSGRCGETKCPEFCLCMEVTCCFAMSVATTRYMIQDELRIVTTKCDK
jgi:hypothetical protein